MPVDSFSLAVSPPLMPQATPQGSAMVAPLFEEERCGGWLGTTTATGSTATAFGDEPFSLNDLIASLPMSAAYPIDSTATSPQRHRGSQPTFADSPGSTEGGDNDSHDHDGVEGTVEWGGARADALTTSKAQHHDSAAGENGRAGQETVLPPPDAGGVHVRDHTSRSSSKYGHRASGSGGVQVSELLQLTSSSSTRTTPVKLPPPQIGADLNMPPSAWLRSSGGGGGCEGQIVPSHCGPTHPWDPVSSTFAMVDVVANLIESQDAGAVFDGGWRSHAPPHQSFFAASASDVVPEVPDVVCPAEQLKRILKANINGSPLAFVAHRIGPSVVIEGNPQPQSVGTVKEARNKALKSKLLYFSVLAANDDGDTPSPTNNGSDTSPTRGERERMSPTPDASSPHVVPPPSAEATTAISSSSSKEASSVGAFEQPPPSRGEFRKCLHWQFDDLSVLLGTNTPTVSLPSHPGKELTLQLVNLDGRQRNAAQQPLLTRDEALDVWLDTIMSNVDGVALCYHTDGVVEGCQVVSTANIPSLAADSFAPIAVQREARNVLRWLTTACAKTGGSYVVIKETHGSTLRLYDISSFGPSDDAAASYHAGDQGAQQASNDDVKRVVADDAPSSLDAARNAADATQVTSPHQHHAAISSWQHDGRRPPSFAAPDDASSGLGAIDDEVVTPKCSGGRGVTRGATAMGHDARLRWRRRRDMFQTFSFPVAMMCLRMAQALRNSDAETLRLLQKTISLLEDGEVAAAVSDSDAEDQRDAAVASAVRARVTFPLAKAHAMCMHHYHSSSPLQDAEALCLHHASRSLHYCGVLCDATLDWVVAEYPPAARDDGERQRNDSGNDTPSAPPASSGAHHKRLHFLQAQDAEVDSIVGEVVRCAAAIASQQVKAKATFLDALGALSICQQGVWLRRHFIAPCMTASGALYDLSGGPWLQWTNAVHRFASAGRQQGNTAVVARRQEDVSAALLELETLVGDMCWNCAASMKPSSEQPAASPSSSASTSANAKAIVSRADASPLSLLGHYNREGPLAVAQAKRGVVGGTPLDFVSRVLPLPPDRHKLLELSETAFRRATIVAQVLGMQPRFQQRKCAGIVAEQANLLISTIQPGKDNDAGGERVLLDEAARNFDKAAHLFLEADDLANALMMAINHSKMLVRCSALIAADASQASAEQRPAHSMCSLLNAAMCVEAMLGRHDAACQQQGTNHATNDELNRVVASSCSHLANLYLMCFQRLSSADRMLEEPLSRFLCGTLSTAVKALSDHVHGKHSESTDAPPTQQQQQASAFGSVKDAESALYRWFLLPGYKLAKRAGALPLEVHLIKVGYTFHMSCAGLTPLHAPLQSNWPYASLPTAARVDSARFAAARCRQYLSRVGTASAVGSQSVWGDCVNAFLATCDLVATYAFLLKHAQVLASLANDGPEAKDSAHPSNASEAEVDLIERALTSVCSVAPLVAQISEIVGGPALALGRSDPDMGDLRRGLSSIHTSVSAVALYLLRQLQGSTTSNRKPDAVRAIARHAAVAASAAIEPNTTTTSVRAGLKSCQTLLEMLDDLFDGKRKKQVSKFF